MKRVNEEPCSSASAKKKTVRFQLLTNQYSSTSLYAESPAERAKARRSSLAGPSNRASPAVSDSSDNNSRPSAVPAIEYITLSDDSESETENERELPRSFLHQRGSPESDQMPDIIIISDDSRSPSRNGESEENSGRLRPLNSMEWQLLIMENQQKNIELRTDGIAMIPHFRLSLISNVNPLAKEERRAPNFFHYVYLNAENRVKFWKRNGFEVIENHRDEKLFAEEEIRVERKIRENSLGENVYPMNKTLATRLQECSLLAARSFNTLGNVYKPEDDDVSEADCVDFTEGDAMKGIMRRYADNRYYTAPSTRIRITDNIAFSMDHKIPVYSDRDHSKFPESLIFDYILSNVVDCANERLLSRAIEVSREPENTIKCNCHSQKPIVECYNNPNCPCFKMNKLLQSLQKTQNPAEFTTNNPLIFGDRTAAFYSHCGFACSEDCGCKGECTNNAALFVDKHIYPVEIYREKGELGFGVRSTSNIEGGFPIMEFSGEIVESHRLHREVTDYSMQLTDEDGDRELNSLLKTARNWSPEFVKILNELGKRQYHLDCKMQGNVARFLNHSCTPNAEPLRVFTKSVTPANMRMFIYSLRAILPGEPITIDYGPDYSNFVECLCNSFSCRHGKYYNRFRWFPFLKVTQCFSKLRILRFVRNYNMDNDDVNPEEVEKFRQDHVVGQYTAQIKFHRFKSIQPASQD